MNSETDHRNRTLLESDLLRALVSLETRLNGTLSSGLTNLNSSIAGLQTQLNKALLEQERRNATLADRDRLDGLTRRVDGIQVSVDDRTERIREVEGSVKGLADESRVSLRNWAGYIFTAAAITGGTVLAFILQHLK